MEYLQNCFLLLIPIFLWNILLYKKLPEAYRPEIFEKKIPKFISMMEAYLRILVYFMPLLMNLSIKTATQELGLTIYLPGLILYFASWLMLIFKTNSKWSKSAFGFTAAAHSPIFWFIGIALIGTENFFSIPYFTHIYIFCSVLFLIFHTMHAYIVWKRL